MRESRSSSWATAQGRAPLARLARPPHSIPAPTLPAAGAGPSSPKGTQCPMTRCPSPGASRSLPARSSHSALRTGGRGAESTAKGGVPSRLAEDWRCAGERVPTPLPSRSASAPRSGLLCATRSAGGLQGWDWDKPWPPWGPEGGSPMPPHVSALQSLRPGGPRTPIPTLRSALPGRRLARRWGSYTPRRPGTERLAGGGGRGAARRPRQVH